MIARLVPVLAVALSGLALPALATPTAVGPAQAAPAAPTARAGLTVVGPGRVALGDSVHLTVDGGAPGATYEWDLDGDGTYERDTGGEDFVDFGFSEGGRRKVAVRVTGGSGPVVAKRTVTVTRPDVARLVLDPPNPRPGQQVELRVVSRSDRGGFAAYAWDVEGVQPTRKKATYRGGGSGNVQQLIDLSGSGLDVTSQPELTVTMPKGKQNDGRTVGFSVTAINDAGGLTTLKRTVTLDLAPDPGQDPYEGQGTIDCDNPPKGVPTWPCAQVGVTGDLLAGMPAIFFDGTPSIEACWPTKDFQTDNKDTVVTELKNLGYPPPEVIALGGEVISNPGGRSTPPVRRTAKPKEVCEDTGGRTLLWEWGDGTTTKANGQDASKGYVWSHVYEEPGTYTVHLTSLVPYLTNKIKGGPSGIRLRHFKARASWEIEVRGADCDGLSMHGIPLRATSYLKTDGCFVPQGSLQGKGGTVYRVQQGYRLTIGGQEIRATQMPPLVDLATGTVSVGSGVMSGRWDGTSREAVPEVTSFVVPPPAFDPDLGVSASALPALEYPDPKALTAKTAGLPTPAVQVNVSPEKPAMLKAYVELPAPLAGANPAIVMESDPTYDRQALAEETDVELDLGDTDVGGFHVVEGTIAHRTDATGGGWFGGVTLDVAGVGTLVAPYVPPGDSSADCETTDGPSGLSLKPSGGFDFAGVQVLPETPIAVGPLGLECLALRGDASPFTMVGKAGLSAPYGGPISLDACLAFSILDAGQSTSGCGTSLTAPSDLVWVYAGGTAGLFDLLTLGSAHLDTRIGPGYQVLRLGGRFAYDYASFSVKGDVAGTVVVEPALAFDLIGSVKLCQENPIKDLCGTVSAGVSSKGFGACAWFGGFVYLWDGGPDVFVASCDLKARIGVGRATAYRRLGTVASVPVPGGKDEVAFAVTSDSGEPPTVVLTRPNGTQIVHDGSEVQRFGNGTTVVEYPTEATTTVTVPKPPAGDWTVGTLDEGDPQITVQLYTPDVEPTVEGTVVGTGRNRSLRFDATLGSDDRLVLVEQGSLGTRVLARPARSATSIRIPAAGEAGKRTVRAIVERHGIPYRQVVVDTYTAPAAARLGATAKVTVEQEGSVLHASWQPVPGATAYDVTAVLRDGRTIRTRVDETSADLRGVTDVAGGKVRVVALGGVGLDGPAATRELQPRTVVVLRL